MVAIEIRKEFGFADQQKKRRTHLLQTKTAEGRSGKALEDHSFRQQIDPISSDRPMKLLLLTALLFTGLFFTTGCVTTTAKADKPKPYKLDKCLVINRKLQGRTYTRVLDGQEYKFCCRPCTSAFDENPVPWVQKYKEETGTAPVAAADSGTSSTATAVNVP